MKNRIFSSPVVMMAALVLMAGAAVVQAQDRGNHFSNQPTTSQRHDQSDQRQQRDRTTAQTRPETATRNDVERDHNHTESARAPEQTRAPPRRVASADRATMIARYRREHPRAAARCHDGFFTNTADRHRACVKHGGIEIWLLP